MNTYNRQLAHDIRGNIERFLETHPQAEALSSGYLYGGKRVREHPQAGFTAYSQDPATLVPSHGNLMLHNFNEENKIGSGRKPPQRLTNAIKQKILCEHPELMKLHLSGGAIDWKNIWDGIKKGASFINKAAPIVSELAPEEYKDTINKTGNISGTISGMGRVSKSCKGAGFWKDFGDGFVKGIKESTSIASKVLPIVTAFQPEIAPVTGAVLATNEIINKGSGRKGRPRKMIGGDLYPPAVQGGKMSNQRRKSVGHAKNQARGALIRQLMREKGLTLPQASSYIKQQNIPF